MARNWMSQPRLIKRLLNNYADCIAVEDGEVNYEESCYRISVKIMETLSESQLNSVFGFVFEDQQECFDHIVKKIPGLCEAMIEFVENNEIKQTEE